MNDPFAPARRALLVGPAMIMAGGFVVYLGAAGSGLSWLLCIPGGLLALLGVIRVAVASAILLRERHRKSLLREGLSATATIVTARQLSKKMGYPVYEMELRITRPDGTESTVKRTGAIPMQYEGSLDAGEELPVRVDPDGGSEFAVEWDSL